MTRVMGGRPPAGRLDEGRVGGGHRVEEVDADADAVAVLGARVFVGGNYHDADLDDRQGLVRAYRARNGSLLWEDAFNAFGDDLTGDDIDAAAAGGGRVVFVGEPSSPSSGADAMIRVHVPRTGAVAWQELYDESGSGDRGGRPRRLARPGLRPEVGRPP